MIQDLHDDFDDFMKARLDAAQDKLALDESYVDEFINMQRDHRQFKATLSPEQTELYEAISYASNVYLLRKSERNAYKAGLADGLKLMTQILGG